MRALLLILLLAGCPANWRHRDSAAETALFTVTTIDWSQTRGITANCSESNPIIGECGDRVNIHVYFVGVLLTELLVARLLPSHWRSVLHGAWIGAETATVIDNEID